MVIRRPPLRDRLNNPNDPINVLRHSTRPPLLRPPHEPRPTPADLLSSGVDKLVNYAAEERRRHSEELAEDLARGVRGIVAAGFPWRSLFYYDSSFSSAEGEYRLTELDMRCLAPRRTLNDAVVDAYCRLLSRALPDHGDVMLLPALFSRLLVREPPDYHALAKVYEQWRPPYRDVAFNIAMPLFVDDHWAALVISLDRMQRTAYLPAYRKGAKRLIFDFTCSVYNSLGSYDARVLALARQTASAFDLFLSSVYYDHLPFLVRVHGAPALEEPCPRQWDGTSCGVYALMALRATACMAPHLLLSEDRRTVDACRALIRHELEKGSIVDLDRLPLLSESQSEEETPPSPRRPPAPRMSLDRFLFTPPAQHYSGPRAYRERAPPPLSRGTRLRPDFDLVGMPDYRLPNDLTPPIPEEMHPPDFVRYVWQHPDGTRTVVTWSHAPTRTE